MSSTFITGKTSSPVRNRIFGRTDTARAGRLIARLVRRWWRAYCRWDDRLHQRRHLGALDDRLLADIGVNQMQARREASRWFVV